MMHAGRIMYALARHFDWFRNRMMPEFYIDGGRADLVFITRSNYVTEIEIKVSLVDWKKDAAKGKWKAARPHIARFFYAVPASLIEGGLPDWLPAHAGVLAVHDDPEYSRDYVREVRAARRLKAKKLDDKMIVYMLESCYYRFWHREINRLHQLFTAQRATAHPQTRAA